MSKTTTTPDKVSYKGKSYPTKTIELRSKIGKDTITSTIKVAPKSLSWAYDEENMEKHNSIEQKLDASIYCYVEDEVLDTLPKIMTDADVAELLSSVSVM
jgi:hypothetical protein